MNAGAGKAISRITFLTFQLLTILLIRDMRASLPPYGIACGEPQYLQGGSPSVAKALLSYVGRERSARRS